MACTLINGGISINCGENNGGVLAAFVADYSQLNTNRGIQPTSVTIGVTGASAGIITGVTGATGDWYEISFWPETADFKDNVDQNITNGTNFSTQTLTITVPRREAAKYFGNGLGNGITNLRQKLLSVIVLDANGNYWMMGLNNGVICQKIDGGTGKAKGDMNGYTFTFEAKEPFAAYQIASSVATSLIVRNSTL